MSAARLQLGICVLLIASGCVPESEILTGWWQSKEAVVGRVDLDERGGVLPHVGIELVIGHYGPDVAGVVRFYDHTFSPDDDTGHNLANAQGCGCTFIENGRYRGSRRLTFRIGGDSGCLPDAVLAAPDGPGDHLEFVLDLVEDDVMTGEIRYASGSDPSQPILFQRDLERYLAEEDKQCELEQ